MAATNAQKIPALHSLARGMARATANHVQRLGKCLPCSVVDVSGAIITVKFEVNAGPITLPQATMPLFGPEYIRYPIQVGDKGFALSADAYLGQMSSMGDGVADLTEQPNLSTLVFMPIGNKNWFAVDPETVTIYGPNGVVLRDTSNACSATLTPHSLDVVAPAEVKLDTPVVRCTGNLSVAQGASGTFTSVTGQVITVQDGIITNIY
jgi:hypothetical protein